MTFQEQIKTIFRNGNGIADGIHFVKQHKEGKTLEIYLCWIEQLYILENLKLGKSETEVLNYINSNSEFFTRNWNLKKIGKLAIKTRGSKSSTSNVATTAVDHCYTIDPVKTYGIEIEFYCEGTNYNEIASFISNHGIACYNGNRSERMNSWKICGDGSLYGIGGGELVSPKLKGQKGLDEIAMICKLLKKLKCKITTHCGLHVHHDAKIGTETEDKEALKNAVYIYTKYQSQINKIMPPSRRNNRFAKYWKQSQIEELFTSCYWSGYNRYQTVNLQAYVKHKTCEFRQHSGTIEEIKIINWVIITQAIMKKSVEFTKKDQDVRTYLFNKKLVDEFKFDESVKTYYNNRAQRIKNTRNTQSVAA